MAKKQGKQLKMDFDRPADVKTDGRGEASAREDDIVGEFSYTDASPLPARQELPEGWVWTTLGKATKPMQKRVNPQLFPDLPYIGMENIEAHTMRLLGTVQSKEMHSSADSFFPGDVLYGRLRPYLNKVYSPDFCGLCSTEFIILRKLSHINSRFLQYFLNSWVFVRYANSLNAGDRPRVKFEQLADYPFPLPPLPEQERIVAKIEELFTQLEAGVAALRRVQAGLKRYKASVLKAAVEGRLTNHPPFPGREGGQKVLGQFELPKGWQWETVGEVASKVTDGTHSTPKYVDSGIPFISVNNISIDGYVDFSNCKYITQEEHDQLYKRCNPERGDVLLTKVGTVGLTAVIKTDTVFSLFVNTALIKPIRGIVLPEFLSFALRFGFISKAYDEFISGSTQKFIGNHKIAQLLIPLPPLLEQLRIVSEVEQRLSIILVIERIVKASLERSSSIRQAILKKSFEGKL